LKYLEHEKCHISDKIICKKTQAFEAERINIYVDSLIEKRNSVINYTFVRWLLNHKYAKGRTY
jgi:hypothetical protein